MRRRVRAINTAPMSKRLMALKKSLLDSIRDAKQAAADKNRALRTAFVARDLNAMWQLVKVKRFGQAAVGSLEMWRTAAASLLNVEVRSSIADAVRRELSALCPDVAAGGGMNETIAPEEVESALKRIKKGTSADANGLRGELIMNGGEAFVSYLTRLLRVVWESAIVPTDWQDMPLTPVYKNAGSRSDPGNYRMLCAGSIVGKVYETVLLSRLAANGFAEYMAPEQIGFRPGFGIDDHVFSLLELVHANASFPTFAAFIDLRKAYDSVWRDALWLKVWRAGIRGRMYLALRSMYASVTAYVKVNGERTGRFGVETGLRQGAVLSPVLFNIFINDLVGELTAAGLGVRVKRRAVGSLLYADDLAILATSAEDLQKGLDVLTAFCERWSLIVNLGKSAVLVFKSERATSPIPAEWRVSSGVLRRLYVYKYLGVLLRADMKWSDHIAAVRKRYAAGIGKMCNAELPCGGVSLGLRAFVFDAVVMTSVSLGGGAVPLTLQKDVRELEVLHRRALRWLLSAPPYAVSCAVAAELGHTTAEAVRDCRTLSFFGALHRKPAGSICGQVFASTWEDRASKSASPWVKHVSRLLELYGLDCEQVMDKSAWKRVVKAAVAKVSGERWRNDCRQHLCSSIRLSPDHAIRPSVDTVTDSLQPSTARIIVALRCGAAGLMLERFRMRRALSYNCTMCDTGACEDLPHLLLDCAAYTDARVALMKAVPGEYRHNWIEKSPDAMMQALLLLPVGRTVHATVVAAIAEFVSGVWAIRSVKVERWNRTF